MLRKWVLVEVDYGVLLKVDNNLSIWSLLDCAGLDKAMVFDTPEDAWLFMDSWDNGFEVKPVPVVVAHPDFATIRECVKAGLPGWYPPLHDSPSKWIN